MIITNDMVEKWVNQLEKAWTERDTEAAVSLFSECIYYQEGPYLPVGRTIDDYRRFWAEVTEQKSIQLAFAILSIANSIATIHWKAKFSDIDGFHDLDGIYVVEFNDRAACTKFMQWTVAKEDI